MSRSHQLSLRIDVAPMPAIWCTPPEQLSLALQSGRDGLARGTKTDDGVRFDVVVGVKSGRDGAPDFTGPLVHGRPGERFLYLSWGQVAAESEHAMFRRLKLYLSPVTRKDWSSPGIGWEMFNAEQVICAQVSGRGPDGTPHCGTAPVCWQLDAQEL